MIRSMTGFGEASASSEGIHQSLEIRSLNNKYLKVTVRLPDDLQSLEAILEAQVRKKLARGAVTINCRIVDTSRAAAHSINTEALSNYLDQLNSIPDAADQQLRIDIASLLSLPGVLQEPADEQSRMDHIREMLLKLLDEACDQLINMRKIEGKRLHDDLMTRHAAVVERLNVIAERAPQVVVEYQNRLEERIENLLASRNVAVEPSDLIREIAIFAEKSDIAEEVTRLSGHMDQFQDLLSSNGEMPIGRTLDFLAQEMLREANTIASKSSDALISRMIVEVKGEIDRIKEQAANVE